MGTLLVHLWEHRPHCWSGDNAFLIHARVKRNFEHRLRTLLNYPLRPCVTCSSLRFPLGYCPSFNSLPLLSSTIFDVLPRPNEQHLCLFNHLHPSCIFSVLVRLLYIWLSFQLPFLELFVRCLVSGLLDAVGLILSVDLELIASGWSFFLSSLPAFWLWA